MALSEVDRKLLGRCLEREPRAWEDFVDRFVSLVVHVVNHSAACHSQQLTSQKREELVAGVFQAIAERDLAVLRNFRGGSSLSTYLAVVARRLVLR